MTSRDRARDDETHDPDDSGGDGGQVSETSKPEPAAGGADATDKSTGTAPDRADQPED